jgi:hypothetical protein
VEQVFEAENFEDVSTCIITWCSRFVPYLMEAITLQKNFWNCSWHWPVLSNKWEITCSCRRKQLLVPNGIWNHAASNC